jgi:GNAT superfamily N-acetyltransferase
MAISSRPYQHDPDFRRVGDFLVEHFWAGNQDGNWLQPAWEYMHTHPALDRSVLDKIRIWEDDEVIAGVVHYESRLDEAFFQVHPNYPQLKRVMLEYAEVNLHGVNKSGERTLLAYVNDMDLGLSADLATRGYQRKSAKDRPMAQFVIPEPYPEINLPHGYRLKSLQEDNDLRKINRVLWRGFNHAGEPPEEEIKGRGEAQVTLNFRKDLTMVVEGPDGNFVSYCGIWLDPANRYCYVEPVATDPDHRRMGLGKAAVMEGIRRCALLGVPTAFVWNDLEIYAAIGFKVTHTTQCWMKTFEK